MGVRGKNDRETRSLAGLAGYFHFSTVMLNDLFHDGKSDTGSLFAGGFGALSAVEFLKNLA